MHSHIYEDKYLRALAKVLILVVMEDALALLQFCVALFFFGLRLMRRFSLLLKMSDFRIK